MADQITDAEIVERVLAPKRASNDEGTVEERDVAELFEAQERLQKGTAAGAVPWGLTYARARPAGTV